MFMMPESGCLGAAVGPNSTGFRVFAPSAVAAWVVLYDEPTGSRGRMEFPLIHYGGGIWEATVMGEWEGRFYVYRFAGPGHESGAEVIDLWAVNAVDSARRARLTDLRRTDPPGWERGRIGPELRSPVDAVIIELHVRDLTISASSGVRRRGGYLGWCESGTSLPGRPDIHTALEHLVELGVTHVQLMPVQDFDGDDLLHCYSWGYMPAAHFSPEGTFTSDPMSDARCREIKHLIQALHLRGIGVILDVVHNHAGKTAPFDAHAPGYYFRHWPDGARSDGSGCGNEFRSESEQGRRFIIENLKFWVREYGIDGFRFDLMALIDRETVLQAERELRALKPDILLYGEPWTAAPSPIDGRGMDKSALAGSRCGGFNDDFRNAIKGAPDGPQPGFIQSGWNRDSVRRGILGEQEWAPSPAHVIQYLACHDNLCLHDKLAASKPGADTAGLCRMAALGHFLVLVSQGVPFLHGGDEFLRTKQGDANSYRSPDVINEIDWTRKALHHELFRQIRKLIALRKAHPLFRLTTAAEVVRRCRFHHHPWWDTVVMEIDGRELADESWNRALILVNGSPDAECAFEPPPGAWENAFGQCAIEAQTCRMGPQTAVVLAEHNA
jgi:pullulanase